VRFLPGWRVAPSGLILHLGYYFRDVADAPLFRIDFGRRENEIKVTTHFVELTIDLEEPWVSIFGRQYPEESVEESAHGLSDTPTAVFASRPIFREEFADEANFLLSGFKRIWEAGERGLGEALGRGRAQIVARKRHLFEPFTVLETDQWLHYSRGRSANGGVREVLGCIPELFSPMVREAPNGTSAPLTPEKAYESWLVDYFRKHPSPVTSKPLIIAAARAALGLSLSGRKMDVAWGNAAESTAYKLAGRRRQLPH
jgi:hypothetical protein